MFKEALRDEAIARMKASGEIKQIRGLIPEVI